MKPLTHKSILKYHLHFLLICNNYHHYYVTQVSSKHFPLEGSCLQLWSLPSDMGEPLPQGESLYELATFVTRVLIIKHSNLYTPPNPHLFFAFLPQFCSNYVLANCSNYVLAKVPIPAPAQGEMAY